MWQIPAAIVASSIISSILGKGSQMSPAQAPPLQSSTTPVQLPSPYPQMAGGYVGGQLSNMLRNGEAGMPSMGASSSRGK